MPAKAPIYLKNAGGKNVAGNKGSKKLREILSTDMISPPLGDFRHTAHVGRGGSDDMFGDTSFLQNDANLKIDDGNTAKSDKENSNGARKGFSLGSGSRTLDRVKKDRSKKHGSNDGDANCSPILQSAFSLPQLNASALAVEQNPDGGAHSSQEDSKQGVGCSRSEEDIKTANQSDFKTPAGSCEGPPKPRRILASSSSKGRENGGSDNNHDIMPKTSVTQKHLVTERSLESPCDDDYWKFDIDLGPSLMDEIMGAIGTVRPAQ